MTNHETIAAFIAARAPEPRYGSPFSLAFEQAERELGDRIGYPTLVYQKTTKRPDRYYFEPSRDGGSDIMDEDRPIRDTDIVDRLNEQDDDLTRARATVQQLRADLDAAHQHIGACVSAMQEIANCGQYVRTTRGEPRNRYTAAEFGLHATLTAARAFLRRA